MTDCEPLSNPLCADSVEEDTDMANAEIAATRPVRIQDEGHQHSGHAQAQLRPVIAHDDATINHEGARPPVVLDKAIPPENGAVSTTNTTITATTTPGSTTPEVVTVHGSTTRRDGDTDNSAVPTATTAITTPAQSPGPSLRLLTPSDMGEQLISVLGEMPGCDDGIVHFAVPAEDLSLASLQAGVDEDGLQYRAIEYQASPKPEGYTRVWLSDQEAKLDWTAFSEAVKRPTIEEARNIIGDTIQSPPAGPIAYLTGHANIPFRYPLNPGPIIQNEPGLADLHTVYHHIGGNRSANRMHQEDLTIQDQSNLQITYHGFRSYNEVYAGPGYKLRYYIQMHHTPKFIDFFKKQWKSTDCRQILGHQSLLIAPSRLEKEGIDYGISIVGRGEGIVTAPGLIHGIYNLGPNAARSMNYLLPRDKIFTEGLPYCSDCGLAAFLEKRGGKQVPPLAKIRTSASKWQRRPNSQVSKVRQTRACAATKRVLDGLERGIREKDPSCRMPRIDPESLSKNSPVLRVLVRVASIRGLPAIRAFIDLVSEWRNPQNMAMSDSNTEEDLLLQHGRRLTATAQNSYLAKFRLRYAQACLAREVDKDKQRHGKGRYSGVTRLAKQLEMEVDCLNRHIEDGRLWNTICGPYDGLLPFISLDMKQHDFHIKKSDWKELRYDKDKTLLPAFHGLLDDGYTNDLCQAGKVFQDIVTKGSELRFQWESGESPDLTGNDRASVLAQTAAMSEVRTA
ncbi:hypothetical protein QQZ08_011582 [Neonectria magnoliae]|uniref:JmjC domain-containing protein n=1 Tax=Neonectria magnoliae TaxID=2732573 RepID=A0ABR1H9G7_9HYPO